MTTAATFMTAEQQVYYKRIRKVLHEKGHCLVHAMPREDKVHIQGELALTFPAVCIFTGGKEVSQMTYDVWTSDHPRAYIEEWPNENPFSIPAPSNTLVIIDETLWNEYAIDVYTKAIRRGYKVLVNCW